MTVNTSMTWNTIGVIVNTGTGKLIVGDPNPFTMMASDLDGFVTLSQDGTVNVYDLADLANNYGWTAGGGDPVPEPATLGLIALGALAVIRWRRR